MAFNKSVKLEMKENKTTYNAGRFDVVLTYYEHTGETVRATVYDDVPEGRAETARHAIKRTLGLLGYTVFE